jgi:hypothetical protein
MIARCRVRARAARIRSAVSSGLRLLMLPNPTRMGEHDTDAGTDATDATEPDTDAGTDATDGTEPDTDAGTDGTEGCGGRHRLPIGIG